MGKKEARVEDHLVTRAKEAGGMCLKFISGVTGVPDRVVILNGHTVFVETKAPGEEPEKLQLVRISEMTTAGARAVIIDTREQVEALIEELLAEPGNQPAGLQRCHAAPVLSPEGFCPEHGWDCLDYSMHLRENSEPEPNPEDNDSDET